MYELVRVGHDELVGGVSKLPDLLDGKQCSSYIRGHSSRGGPSDDPGLRRDIGCDGR